MFLPGMKVVNHFDRSLGIGTVKDIDPVRQRLTISFSLGEERIYTAEGVRGLNRIIIRPVDKCLFTHDGSSLKGRVTGLVTDNPEDVRIYNFEGENGEKLQIPEDHFEVLTGLYSDDPVMNLSNLRFGSAKWFDRRTNLLFAIETLHNKSRGLFSLIGARLYPFPHQAFVVKKVLCDSHRRFMLADEVGLGKTIEAGLISLNLIRSENIKKILIIAPDTLAHQWFCEMYIKFGKRVFIFMDENRYSDLGLDWIDNDQVICSIEFLNRHKDEWDYIAQQSNWDMLIIDEAHHIKPEDPIGELLRRLSKKTKSVLVLTATPITGHEKQYLNVLSLFDPQLYEKMPLSKFKKRLKLQEDLSAMLIATEDADPDEWLKNEWLKILPGDEQVRKLCDDFEKDPQAPNHLCRYIENYYKINKRIIRNKRQAGHIDLPARSADICVYEDSPAQKALQAEMDLLFKLYAGESSTHLPRLILSLCQAAASSPFAVLQLLKWGVNKTKDNAELNAQVKQCLNRAQGFSEVWAREDNGKLSWLNKFLNRQAREGHKHVLFDDSLETIKKLVDYLKSNFGADAIAEFHRGLNQEKRDDEAMRFTKNDDCLLLICDELGGEGRNFQMAKGIVHYDLPWQPFKLEQRIGRLDRLGRWDDVVSYVPVTQGWIDASLAKVYLDAIKIFSQSASGLEFVFDEITKVMAQAIVSGGTEGLLEAVEHIERVTTEEREKKAADLILDRSSYSPEDNPEATEIVKIEEADTMLAKHVGRWAKAIGASRWINPVGEGTVSFQIQRTKIPLYGIYEDHTYYGTFFREVATKREDINFFSLGHELVDAFIESAKKEKSSMTTMVHRYSEKYAWTGFRILISIHANEDKIKKIPNSSSYFYEVESSFPREPFHLFVRTDGEDFSLETDQEFIEWILSKSERGESRMFRDEDYADWDIEHWGKSCRNAVQFAFAHLSSELCPLWKDLVRTEKKRFEDDLFLLENAAEAIGDDALGLRKDETEEMKKRKKALLKALKEPCMEVLAMAYYDVGPFPDR